VSALDGGRKLADLSQRQMVEKVYVSLVCKVEQGELVMLSILIGIAGDRP
jgi:hypothetical protein